MSVAEGQETRSEFPVNREAAEWVSGLKPEDIPQDAYIRARHAILDWLGCTIAGMKEPLSEILCEELEAGSGECTVVGGGAKARLLDAALINGAASHALDYDDVNRDLHGHPTVCVAPASLGVAELLGASGRDALVAHIIGTEISCRIGLMAGEDHYERGFHATGTLGNFGAAAAAARLMGLDAEKTAMALGIAASQAAGVRANFGTMTKPFHAGKAAANGVLAARLAARGFTAHDYAIEGEMGFADALCSDFQGAPIRLSEDAPWAVENVLYKYHAACYLTHATLNAIRSLREEHGFNADDVETATLKIRSTHASVCCIPEPRTGLEIKFSIEHLAAMALDGVETGALEVYSDENALDPRYVETRKRAVRIDYDDEIDRNHAVVTVTLRDGRTVSAENSVREPAKDHGEQWKNLSAKFRALCVPLIGADRTEKAIALIDTLDAQPDVRGLMGIVG